MDGPKIPQTFGDHLESQMAGANTVRSERWIGRAPYGEVSSGALSSNSEAR